MITKVLKLSEIPFDLSLRLDCKAVVMNSTLRSLSKSLTPLLKITISNELQPVEKPTEPFYYHEISTVDKFGIGNPIVIDENNIEIGSEEERLLKKIDRGDIALPTKGDILVPKIRPSNGKFVFIKNKNALYFTTAFLALKSKTLSPEMLYCILKHSSVLRQLSRISRIGKGYPIISGFELTRFVYVPKQVLTINRTLEDSFKKEVGILFQRLNGLRSERDIIDEVFERYVHHQKSKYIKKPEKSFVRNKSQFGASFNIRMSSHFLNPERDAILAELGKLDTTKIIRLSALPITLGISPELNLEESEFFYLGPQAMAGEHLDPDGLSMVSEEYYKRNSNLYQAAIGDVFVRRSGASLGKTMYFDSDLKCIFSDFMMRIRPISPEIGKYISFWLRSTLMLKLIKLTAVIGKGLQNIYPYQIGLLQIPSPNSYEANKIVQSIEEEIEKNNKLRSEVEDCLKRIESRLNEELGFSELSVGDL